MCDLQVLRSLPERLASSRQPSPSAAAGSDQPKPDGILLDEVLGLHAWEQSPSTAASTAALCATWHRMQQQQQQQQPGSSRSTGPSQQVDVQLGGLSAAYAPGFATMVRVFAEAAFSPSQAPSSRHESATHWPSGARGSSERHAVVSAAGRQLVVGCQGSFQVKEMQLVLLSDSSPGAMGVMLLSSDLSARLGFGQPRQDDAAGVLIRWAACTMTHHEPLKDVSGMCQICVKSNR